jgi:hypothetical protein
MAKTSNPGVVQTLTAFTPPIGEKLFVKADGTLCGAGELAAGVSMNSVDSDSKTLGICCTGIVPVLAGGTCTINSKAESDANGKAVDLTTGEPLGIFMDSGSTGDEVRVLLK